MTADLVPAIFTIDIGDTPTVTFEAQNLREARKLCHEHWLMEDLAEAKSGGVPLMGKQNCEHGSHCPRRPFCLSRPKIMANRLTVCCSSTLSNWTAARRTPQVDSVKNSPLARAQASLGSSPLPRPRASWQLSRTMWRRALSPQCGNDDVDRAYAKASYEAARKLTDGLQDAEFFSWATIDRHETDRA
jgi:hypothetical protein